MSRERFERPDYVGNEPKAIYQRNEEKLDVADFFQFPAP